MSYLIILNNFLFITGFIVGLGGVTVIDFLGFFGQKSEYWTQTTIRAHKITKPLIWIGIILLLIAEFFAYTTGNDSIYLRYFSFVLFPLVFNGIFLSFYVSPKLLEIEKNGQDNKLLPKDLKNKIFVSFLISFACWWGSVLLFVLHISQ